MIKQKKPEKKPENKPKCVLVASGGGWSAQAIARQLKDKLPTVDFVAAADSGLSQARELGLKVDVVVGDMDSVSPKELEAARGEGSKVITHPTDKNATDLELALDMALGESPDELLIVGAEGGRMDHLVSFVQILALDKLKNTPTKAYMPGAELVVVKPGMPVSIKGNVGEFVSLIPISASASGVETLGLKFPLKGADLYLGSTRGISNEFAAGECNVSVAGGMLCIVHCMT